MRVAGTTSNGDWIFGRGKASYKTRSEAIRQNVVTGLRPFTNDWFLNLDHGNPWIELFGSKASEDKILRTVEKSVTLTEGVRRLDSLELISTTDRKAVIHLTYTDIFNAQFEERVALDI